MSTQYGIFRSSWDRLEAISGHLAGGWYALAIPYTRKPVKTRVPDPLKTWVFTVFWGADPRQTFVFTVFL